MRRVRRQALTLPSPASGRGEAGHATTKAQRRKGDFPGLDATRPQFGRNLPPHDAAWGRQPRRAFRPARNSGVSKRLMSRLVSTVAAVAASFSLPLAAIPARAALRPDAAACNAGSGRPAALVTVTGFKARSGRVRVQIYDASNFLVRGQRVARVDLPVTADSMPICVALPRSGTYAAAVRHDVNGNSQRGDWSDGGGFSRNPKISFFHLRPSFGEVAFPVGNAPRALTVVLLYRSGLTIGPARG